MSAESIEGKRIAVVGGAGDVGSIFVRKALKQNAEVIVVGRNPKNAEKLVELGAKFKKADVSNRDEVFSALSDQGIEVTYNYSADLSMRSDSKFSWKTNVEGEQNLLDFDLENGTRRHVYISSHAVHIEDENSYSASKREAEKRVMNSKVPEWMILRLTNVMGADNPNHAWNRPFKSFEFRGKMHDFAILINKEDAPFTFSTSDTAAEAAVAAATSKPDQVVTVLDGTVTIGRYLKSMAVLQGIDGYSALPSTPVTLPLFSAIYKAAEKLGLSHKIPVTPAAAKFALNMKAFDSEDMVRQLGINTHTFNEALQEVRNSIDSYKA